MFFTKKKPTIPAEIQALHVQRRKDFRSNMKKAERLLEETTPVNTWRNVRWSFAIFI